MNGSVIIDKLKQYPLAVFCSILLVVFLVVIFLRGDVATELATEESDLNARIRTIEENIKNSQGLKQDLDDLGLLVEQINARLFDRDERAINTNFFYGLEDRVDVLISSIGQLPDSDPVYSKGGPFALKEHSTLVFNISLKGTLDDVLRLFYELHRVDPLIRIADFQLTGGRGMSEKGELFDARLRVLVLAKKD